MNSIALSSVCLPTKGITATVVKAEIDLQNHVIHIYSFMDVENGPEKLNTWSKVFLNTLSG